MEKKTYHSTRLHQVLGAKAKIGYGSGGLVGLAGVGWVWTLLSKIVRLVSSVIFGEHSYCVAQQGGRCNTKLRKD